MITLGPHGIMTNLGLKVKKVDQQSGAGERTRRSLPGTCVLQYPRGNCPIQVI
jgi:hypothetical protein